MERPEPIAAARTGRAAFSHPDWRCSLESGSKNSKKTSAAGSKVAWPPFHQVYFAAIRLGLT